MHKRSKATIAMNILLALLLLACADTQTSINRNFEPVSTTQMKETVDSSYATILKEYTAQTDELNPLIVILEENHASRVGQLQHALTLNNLYHQHNMREIALEGYLVGSSDLASDWYSNAGAENFKSRCNVAVRLLKEGEISSAECLKLIYDDIQIHPIESPEDYHVKMDDDASTAVLNYLVKLGQEALTQSDIKRLNNLQRNFEQLSEDKQNEVREHLLKVIIAADPWVKKKYNLIYDNKGKIVSAEDLIMEVKEIEKRINQKGITLTSADRSAMKRALAFWEARSEASYTMVEITSEIAAKTQSPVLPMVIGAAHSDLVCELFSQVPMSSILVSPPDLRRSESVSDIPSAMYKRKYDQISLYPEETDFTTAINGDFSSIKKPQPVMNQPWFQAKAEAYLYIDRINTEIAEHFLAQSGGPPIKLPPGKPGIQFGPDQFNGKRVYINPDQIEIQDGNYVVFPLSFNYNDPDKKRDIWVKTFINPNQEAYDPVKSTERKMVESALRDAIDETKSGGELKSKVEDAKGRVQISPDTIAGFAATKAGATSISLI